MKTAKVKQEPHRIPYDAWINSQLSIARHYGGCSLNGKRYKTDYDSCRSEGEEPNKKYFPDAGNDLMTIQTS